MRILNLIQCANLGGMEQSNLLRLGALNQLGHSCRMVSLHPIGGLGPLLEEGGVPAEGLSYRGPGGLGSLGALWRALRSSPADAFLMTGHNLAAMFALGGICRDRRVLAIHFHHEGTKPAYFWKLFYKIAATSFKAVTFPSDFVRQEAEQLSPAIARVSHTVPNPFRVQELISEGQKARARRALGVPEKALLVGNAGWLIARKRWDVFFQSAQAILRDQPDAWFLVAGEGPLRASLEGLAESLGVAARVIWLGWQHNLADFYQCLDVLVFPSEWDALGRTPLEALAYGIPVVASVTHGGLGEVLNDGDHGFLSRSHDPYWIAGKVRWIAEHRSQACEMAMAGRERLRILGSPLRHAGRMAELLEG